MLLSDLAKKVLEICEQPAAVAECIPHSMTLQSLPAQILADTRLMLYVIPWCMLRSVLLGQSKGNM